MKHLCLFAVLLTSIICIQALALAQEQQITEKPKGLPRGTFVGKIIDAFSQRDLENNQWLFCIATADILDAKGYYLRTVMIHFTDVAKKPVNENDASCIDPFYKLEGHYARFDGMYATEFRESQTPLYGVLLEHMRARGSVNFREYPAEIPYVRADTYTVIPKEKVGRKPVITTRDMTELRGRVNSFIDDWYRKRDKERFREYLSEKSPLRSDRDYFERWFTGAFTKDQPDTTTFSSQPEEIWTDKSFAGMCSNAAPDNFCILDLDAPLQEWDLFEANNRIKELIHDRKLSAREKVAVALWVPNGDGYRWEIMLAFWIQEQPGFIGRLIGKKSTWRLYLLGAHD